ncbi:MAG: efflux RND transporter permease subunit [Wenzhouxiangella sp.]
MNLIASALSRSRLVMAAVILLSLIGLAAWFGMDRQEDPFFPYRFGAVTVNWPGASPEQVQRLIVNIIEEELATVEEIKEIRSTARLGLAHLSIGMHQHISDTDAVWERVRMVLDRAGRRLPAGAGAIELNDRSMDAHGIVLAITGSDDPLVLLDAARQLRRDLFRVPDMGRIDLIGDPGEVLEISPHAERLAELNLDYAELAAIVHAANQVIPAGRLRAGDRNLVLRADTDYSSLADLAALPIPLADGGLLPLGELAELRIRPEEPLSQRVSFSGRTAVALGIVIPENRLNAVRFGEQVRSRIDELRPHYAPLQIEEMFYQPYWVERRLSELGRSLLLGVLIVGAVLLLAMGARAGIVVALLLPVVTLSSLAVYAMSGGVLQQMAVAGMVIALGMLVDNAIVMVENLQWHLDRGKTRAQAAADAVRELAGPLAAATGTTLAAFTPLLLSRGDTADFTRAIPIMVMLILAVSYVFAVLVTPTLAAAALRPGGAPSSARLERFGHRLGGLALKTPWRILVGALVLIALTLAASGLMQRDFFPSTDRNQLIIDLQFAEGTRIEHSDFAAASVAAELSALEGVRAVHYFAGFSGPRFYYNLIEIPRAPHLARIVLVSDSDRELPGLMQWTRSHVPGLVPDAQVIARRLGQGPPVEAPVEIRLFGRDASGLAVAVERVMAELRATPGAVDVRHRLGDGTPTLHFEIDAAEAARHGISRARIAEVLAEASQGRQASTWRAGREPMPILLRSPEGEALPEQALAGLQVRGDNGLLPLDLFVHTRLSLEPSVIEHRDLERMTAVLAETAPGLTYSDILGQAMPRLRALSLPEGVRLELGGAAAEADTANSAVFQTLPVGVLLLLVFLLWQFNSFRLVGIVLVTVPLAAIGVVPGLILSGQPFGFTAMLGVIALIGIVVNNAIVLIDVIERERQQGAGLEDAITAAVARRIRPILLTTATTIAGLLPLTFTQSTLWPPMAWAIISGLLASTVLTLLVIPATYRLTARAGAPSTLSARV